MNNLRLVIDVNVIISALLFPKSKPNLALEKALVLNPFRDINIITVDEFLALI